MNFSRMITLITVESTASFYIENGFNNSVLAIDKGYETFFEYAVEGVHGEAFG